MGILKLELHATITKNSERPRRGIVVVGDRRRKRRGRKERGK
jgi:hypothetical protein